MKFPKKNNVSGIRYIRRKRELYTDSRSAQGATLVQFLPLSPKEKELMSACTGALTVRPSRTNPNFDPANIVRASFLRFLLMGGDRLATVCDKPIELHDAWIHGELDLSSCSIKYGVRFWQCSFSDAINLRESHVSSGITFAKCNLLRIDADSIDCSRGITIFECEVREGVFLRSAKIAGTLYFGKSFVKTIVGTDIVVGGKLWLGAGFRSNGVVNFSRAQINGVFDCHGAQLNGAGDAALQISRGVIGGDFQLGRKFSCLGKIDLSVTTVGGSVLGTRSYIDGNGEVAINLDGAEVAGVVDFSHADIKGEFRLRTARITLDLALAGAELQAENNRALVADRASVLGGVFLTEGFCANGIRFHSLKVGESLSFSGSKIRGTKEIPALDADRADITGNLFFCKGFSANGAVKLGGVKVGGIFTCETARFENEHGDSLFCEGMTVKSAFRFRRLAAPVNGVVLSSAKVGRLVDDMKSWGENLVLKGFIYNSFAGVAPTDATSRLQWLDKQRPELTGITTNGEKFAPQPWRQLRRVLLDTGHISDAREVAVRYEDRLREIDHIGRISSNNKSVAPIISRAVFRSVHYLFGLLMGYGYRPVKLVCWMLSIWLICGGIYWMAALNNIMAPSNPLVFQADEYSYCKSADRVLPKELINGRAVDSKKFKENWYLCENLAPEYTGFSPLAYSLDVLLPFVDLQQQNDWAPMIPTPKPNVIGELVTFTPEHIVRFVLWFEIIFGWFASLLLVAVFSGLTKRTDE